MTGYLVTTFQVQNAGPKIRATLYGFRQGEWIMGLQHHTSRTVATMDLQPALIESLNGLSKSLDDKVHLLASTGDGRLAEIALDVTKQLFDLGMCFSK